MSKITEIHSFRGRRFIVQVLYAIELRIKDIYDPLIANPEFLRGALRDNLFIDEEDVDEEGANKLLDTFTPFVLNLMSNIEDIDGNVKNCLSYKWRWDRVAMVLRSILRTAAYEISLFASGNMPQRGQKDKGVGFIIVDYIKIAKGFGHGDDIAFINAVLDKLAKQNSDDRP